ncbi:MAG TPA: type III secretion system translocon subunit SctB [Candidatus Competibacteraceae bacterium]|nr:MAG: hypothetical protein EKK71_05605 [Candidatus Competibacteraceae bacterium]HOB61167.1 type III secretion system translocon subunit SctB [Candidatus Competibacteraceae bacterium]HQA24756.1 type III secretion system translocon subunit SctB [Candidatus Competibacteraceae bacterium]HQD55490.1 type III secretion system translocon subunit SctB [Candidatus Competibacteraceae bacterium]
MTTISSSITFDASTTLADMTQSIEQDLKAKGVQGPINQDALVLTKVANQDGSFTVFYQYPLDPPRETPPGSLNDAFDKMNGFIDLGAIMALFHEVALEQRDAAREGRQAQLTVQVTELKNAAQDIRDSALASFVGAMVMGALSIAGGILSVVGSVKAGTQAKAGLEKSQEATQLSQKLAGKEINPGDGVEMLTKQEKMGLPSQIKSLNQQSSSLSQVSQTTLGKYQGWSSLAGGVGGVSKGIGDYISGQEQANSKEDEARATKAGAERDQLIAYQNEAQQLMADIRQMLQQITQNQMETARAILRV